MGAKKAKRHGVNMWNDTDRLSVLCPLRRAASRSSARRRAPSTSPPSPPPRPPTTAASPRASELLPCRSFPFIYANLYWPYIYERGKLGITASLTTTLPFFLPIAPTRPSPARSPSPATAPISGRPPSPASPPSGNPSGSPSPRPRRSCGARRPRRPLRRRRRMLTISPTERCAGRGATGGGEGGGVMRGVVRLT